ncbi:glucose-6-phosphate isomerase family protein [uncultured Pluralibacter sp.]|uniref:glucose-6-phosphate isomerase family protein n=1 Tax=uncultured Pluralibacter sp. TaxID=1490864 RepID=UPI0026156D38|nr:glucose-6-phosphate isomerase family protein [uncultured Pluralibacter sp.]
MDPFFKQPSLVDWLTGAFTHHPLLRKSTTTADLAEIFADGAAWQNMDPKQVIYTVEVLDTSAAEGALFTGVTHLNPGKVGDEFFMTRGHYHARREQGEVYFGLRGKGLLLLQNEEGGATLETVSPGSVHIIPGFTAHRLINTGADILSALAVWPAIAGHDYAALGQGFSLRVKEIDHQVKVIRYD